MEWVVVISLQIYVVDDCFLMQRGSELAKYSKLPAREDDEGVDDEEEDQGECIACGESYVSASDEFWICCEHQAVQVSLI